MTEPAILLVTCCMERTRYEIVKQVFENIRTQCPPEWRDQILVFDNASTYLGAGELLSTFNNVYRSDRNVGYWSAIDWWLQHLVDTSPVMVNDGIYTPRYTYIIESDMIHYGASQLQAAVKTLDQHPEIGACRLHQYDVSNMHLYNKDVPRSDSHRNLWQSHTNKVTGQPIVHSRIDESEFWRTNFLTQLPALNRFDALKRCFDALGKFERFTELDFQRMYHDLYPENSILNGGIFDCNLNPHGSGQVTGSWTDPRTLSQLGYQSTRFASITPRDQYTVTRVR